MYDRSRTQPLGWLSKPPMNLTRKFIQQSNWKSETISWFSIFYFIQIHKSSWLSKHSKKMCCFDISLWHIFVVWLLIYWLMLLNKNFTNDAKRYVFHIADDETVFKQLRVSKLPSKYFWYLDFEVTEEWFHFIFLIVIGWSFTGRARLIRSFS